MTGDWRDYRPAIWLAMLGVALIIALDLYIGAIVLGGAVGVGLQITRRRRAALLAARTRTGKRRRKR